MRKDILITEIKEELRNFVQMLDSSNIEEVSHGIKSQLDILTAIHQATFLSIDDGAIRSSTDTLSIQTSGTSKEDVEKNSEGMEAELDQPEDNSWVSSQLLTEKPIQTQESLIEGFADQATTTTLPDETSGIKETDHNYKQHKEEYLEDGEKIRGFFTQKVRGGEIHRKMKIFVPESKCRELELKTGDFVEAAKVGMTKNRPHYTYKVLDRTNKESPLVRKERTCLLVKKHQDLDRLYLEIEDTSLDFASPVLLSDSDITTYHLKEGDVVDYAHELSNIQKGYVIWKHKIEPLPEPPQSHPQNNHPRAGDTRELKKTRKTRLLPIFDDLKILMIGGGNKSFHKSIRQEVVKRSGKFTFLSGDEQRKTIQAKIKKADIVIIYTQSISHEAMYFAKDCCKEYQKVHSFTKNIGSIEFVRRVSLLKKKLPVA